MLVESSRIPCVRQFGNIRVRRLVAVAAVAACAMGGYSLASASTGATPPPGATAQCNDRTYSFSQTHSGTCSHHGGVAVWLTPSATTPPHHRSRHDAARRRTRRLPRRRPTPAAGTVDVGKTILLAPRTRTSGCKLAANPDRRCSPGAYYSKLTTAVICSSTFRTGTIRDVPQSEKFDVEREYGLAAKLYGSTLEIDHIVSSSSAAQTTSQTCTRRRRRCPADAPGFRVKDKLENKVHDMVCDRPDHAAGRTAADRRELAGALHECVWRGALTCAALDLYMCWDGARRSL